jgi:Rieske Fe-S protein
MYLSDESPAHSLRTVPVDGGEALLIAGEGHAIGDADPADRYAALRQWAEQHFDVESVDYHWAAHDQMPADHAPYVGRLWPLSDRIWTATGFSKWGLAMGVASGRMLADAIAGRDAPWLEALSSTRFTPLASARTATEANAKTGARFFVDRIRRRASAKRLGAGEGAVVGAGLGQRAVYRDEDGHEHSLSARCTHLGCIVSFNSAEKTWDCACHGSRFGIDGEVLQGPAVEPLRREEEEGA